MKDILEKKIQISDLYPPTNVVRTDFTVVFTRFTTLSDSRSKFKMDPTSFDYSQFILEISSDFRNLGRPFSQTAVF